MDDWATPQESLFWLSHDDSRGAIAQARSEIANGEGITEEQIRVEFGVPKRSDRGPR